MKDFILGFLTIIIISVALFFAIKSCQDEPAPPDNSRELELMEMVKEKDNHIAGLRNMIDSLETIKQKVKTQIVYREREIDEAVIKDSTKSLVFYRQALTENGWLPDKTDNLTFREITLGAKGLAKIPKLELQNKLADEQIEKLKLLDEDNGIIKKGLQDIIQIKNLTIKDRDEQLADRNSFWYDRFVIVGGVGGGYTGTNISPFVGVMIGIKIWGNK
jgi:hypothetical protein